MLKNVKVELKHTVELSVQFIESALERNVKFTSHVLEAGLATAKQMRTSKSLSEALKSPVDFLAALQRDVMALTSSNTAALKDFGKSSLQLVKSGLNVKPQEPKSKEKAAAPAVEMMLENQSAEIIDADINETSALSTKPKKPKAPSKKKKAVDQ